MGGGVSLGSFSGASLTEAIKLLLLFGRDKKGMPYTDVVIDGMSGASAGAIALVILLRSLLDYKRVMTIFNAKKGNSESEVSYDSLLQEIADDYFNTDKNALPADTAIREKLVALQMAQKVQRQIWVTALDSKALFGEKVAKKSKKDPHSSFGLLDRNLLVALAKDYVVPVANNEIDLNNRQLLDPKRVVLACSLTNMLPMELGTDPGIPGRRLQENVIKSTGSQNHTELRVIDFVFDREHLGKKTTDPCWFQISESGDDQKMHLNLNGKKAWRLITATALACGAFPIAFEPVLLKRYKEEFPNNTWPKVFEKIKEELKQLPQRDHRKKSFFNENGDNYMDYDSFNFPYVDGGTFNNEPIKEAFRIASFQDFGNQEKDFDRLVLFVDPAVREEKYNSFNTRSFAAVVTKERRTNFKGEVSKLFDNVLDTVGVLANQGSVKEEHRIADVRENLRFRDQLFDYIESSSFRNLTVALVKSAFDKIHKNLQEGLIPLGTRDVLTYFQNELLQNCKRHGLDPITVPIPVLTDIHNAIIANSTSMEEIYGVLNANVVSEEDAEVRINLFAQTIFRMVADFSLGTVGKNEKAEQLSVLPVMPENLYTIKLPGSEVEAFAGFASLESRKYAFEYGRLSTLLSLREEDPLKSFREPGEAAVIGGSELSMIEARYTRTLLELPFYTKEYRFADDLYDRLYKPSARRVVGLFGDKLWKRTALTALPSFLVGGLGGTVAPFALLGTNAFVSIKKALGLKTKAFADDVNFRKLVPITISILSAEKLPRKVKLSFKSPRYAEHWVPMKLHLHADGTRQYLFQLYYLEYLEQHRNNRYEIPESVSMHKTDAQAVTRLGLTLKDRIANPKVDSSLNVFQWRKRIEAESEQIELAALRLKGQDLGNIMDDINNKHFTLFYSLKNLNYHVNPILEYDLRKNGGTEPNSWYFKENTTAFYKTF